VQASVARLTAEMQDNESTIVSPRVSGPLHNQSASATQLETNMDARTASRRATIAMPEPAPTIRMTHSAGEATAGDHPVLHAAVGLSEQIRAASEEIKRGRRIPPSIVAAARSDGDSPRSCYTIISGAETTSDTGVKLLNGSYGTFALMIGCTIRSWFATRIVVPSAVAFAACPDRHRPCSRRRNCRQAPRRASAPGFARAQPQSASRGRSAASA
jgi:hypothetical protein